MRKKRDSLTAEGAFLREAHLNGELLMFLVSNVKTLAWLLLSIRVR